MTALPVKPPIPPEQVLLFIEEIRERFSIVTLDAEDYLDTVRAAANRGVSSGQIYDALLLRCASKIKAKTIYTWYLKHFRTLAPDRAARIRTP